MKYSIKIQVCALLLYFMNYKYCKIFGVGLSICNICSTVTIRFLEKMFLFLESHLNVSLSYFLVKCTKLVHYFCYETTEIYSSFLILLTRWSANETFQFQLKLKLCFQNCRLTLSVEVCLVRRRLLLGRKRRATPEQPFRRSTQLEE